MLQQLLILAIVASIGYTFFTFSKAPISIGADENIDNHNQDRSNDQTPIIRLDLAGKTIIDEGHKVIQEAINALPPEGGIVELPEGVYMINRSIRLHSGVTLRGVGAKSILHKTPGGIARLLEPALKGTSAVLVDHPERFHQGEQVGVVDNQQVGWNATHAIVLGMEDGRLLLNRGVWASYQPELNGALVGLFPLITAANGENVAVEDLAIEAELKEQPSSVLNFTFSAIHFNHVSKVSIRHVAIRSYPGDGVSVQGGSRCQILDNVVQGCLGHGYHAGGGLEDSLFENNRAIGNGGDGFFFCSNVRTVTVRGNLFKGNKGHGVGGLGDWGDTKNVVEANRCITNGGAGIVALNGADNQIVKNFCSSNSQQKPGEFPGILLLNTTDTVVQTNQCIDEKGTQSWGIVEYGVSDKNQITGNICQGNRAGGIKTIGLHTIVQENQD